MSTRAVHDAFVAKFAAQMKALKMGNGLDDGVAVGPLVNADTRDKVAHLVEDALGKGARAVVGGERPRGTGFYYPPTVLVNVPDDALCLERRDFRAGRADRRNSAPRTRRSPRRTPPNTASSPISTRATWRAACACPERLEAGMVGLNRGVVSDPGRALRRGQAVGARPRGRA